ncbi:putative metal-dependent membrane protease [Saccharomonospora marina XMU15]|uniref:Putative metal-dependent membrane protease n=1 Tax=Saccharomonospora marina XMU15 TaxID=882083 RepID=H5WZH6_9PSEU|nr:putative metal-dependent membrane protease [Saccharomonospora marina XMU15]
MQREGDDRPVPPVRTGLVLGAHWGMLAFVLALGGYYAVSLLLSALATIDAADPTGIRLPQLGPLVLLAFVPNVLLGLVPWLGSLRWGNGVRADFGLLPTGRDLKVGLACGGFALLAGYVLNLILLQIYGSERMAGPLIEVFRGISADIGWLVVAAIIVVVGAPLTEELLFRGALWNGLAHYRIPNWVILLLTALLFAQLHGEPTRTVALIAQGVAIGSARFITGRVGASVVAHATNNLPAALFLLIGS